MAFRLAGGGLGDDRREPPAGAGHPDGERDDELADQVAAWLIAVLRRAEGDGTSMRTVRPSASSPRLRRSAGGDRQEDVVDCRILGVRGLLRLVEAGGDEGKAGFRADGLHPAAGTGFKMDKGLYEHGLYQ